MKKIISILLLVSMLALSACSGGVGDAPVTVSETKPAGVSETSASVETTTAEPEPQFKKQDFKGKDFTIAAQYTETYLTMYGNEVYAEKENGEIINDSVFARNREVEELYNINIKHFLIETGRSANPTAVINSILAGEDKIQSILFPTRALYFFVKDSIYVNKLNEIATLDLTNPWWNQNSVSAYTINGANYFVTGDLCYYETMNPMCFLFSKKLVKDLKLDDPYAMVKKGSWTLDNMYGMAKKASADVNGDGKMTPDEDRWGFMSQIECLWYWVIASGITAVEKDAKTDLPTIVLDTGRSASITEKVMDVFNNADTSLIATFVKSTRYPNSTHDLFREDLCSGLGLFYYNTLSVTSNLRVYEGDFGVLPVAKFDDKQDGYYTMTSTFYGTNVMVPITNAKTDEAGCILDAMGYYSKKLVTPAVMEATITNKALRDTESEEMVEIILGGLRYDLENVYSFGVASVFNNLAKNKSKDFASQYASSEAKIKSTLETTVNAIVSQSKK